MKRRSSTSGPPEPVFFTDRDLGRTVAAILRTSGLRVEPYHDHFRSPTTSDVEWLTYVGERGWVAVTHDQRIQQDPQELEALMLAGTKTVLIVGTAPHPALASAFLKGIRKIKRFIAEHSDPFIIRVYQATGEVRMSLTYEEWLHRQRR